MSALAGGVDGASLSQLLDELDHVVRPVALAAGEAQEVSGSFEDGAVLWGAGDGDAAAAAELEQAFVAELPQCAQDRVGVDTEHRGEVLCGAAR